MNQDTEHMALSLDDQLVSQYLQQHPDFFLRNARQVEQMRIPHAVRGSVSLVEWQLGRQRRQIEQLEEEITLLMEHAANNELLFTQLLQLYRELLQVDSLHAFLRKLQNWARSIGLANATIRLFTDKWQLAVLSHGNHLALTPQQFESIRIQKMSRDYHYLGPLNGQEIALLIPEEPYVGSVAMSILGEWEELGVLIFISRNSQHYQANMGTLALEQVSAILPELLTRWVQRL